MSNVDPAGSFNSWARVAFDENKWTELVNNLESTKADWDDSDWKDNEPEEKKTVKFILNPFFLYHYKVIQKLIELY